MISDKIGKAFSYPYEAVVGFFASNRFNPNVLTFTGFAINLFAAYLFATGYFRWAGAAVLVASVFDLTDGPVARVTKRVTPFGGFFDSVLDRYSDLCLLIGLLIYYGRIARFLYVTLVAIAMIGSVMISYTRERAERIVLIIVGGLADRMAPVLWVIAVFSNLTVIHRMIYTYQQSRGQGLSG